MFEQRATKPGIRSRVDSEILFAFGMVATLLLAAEILILFQRGNLGLLVHALTVVPLIAFVSRFDGHVGSLFQSLILLPVLRIFNLGIPPFTQNPLVFLGTIYLFILLSTWIIIRSQNLSLDDLGLTLEDARLLVPGTAIGLVFGVIQFVFALEPLKYEPTLQNYALVILTTGILVGFVEEVIFRGLIQRWASASLGQWPAILSVSILFGFMHSVWLAPLDILFAGSVSVFIGWIYAMTRNMWYITGIHGMINITAFLLAPLYWTDLVGFLSALI